MRSFTPLKRRHKALATLPLTAAVSAAISATATLMPSVAMAQLEEVVVTARARAESLQDVPATVTAFTEGQIENMGVARAEDFVYMTPGVTFVNSVEVGDSQLAIRGINGARDAETNFAFIVDGVLYTNPSAFNREYPDLAQIEVLKGPQGALYGRSAAADVALSAAGSAARDGAARVVRARALARTRVAGRARRARLMARLRAPRMGRAQRR